MAKDVAWASDQPRAGNYKCAVLKSVEASYFWFASECEETCNVICQNCKFEPLTIVVIVFRFLDHHPELTHTHAPRHACPCTVLVFKARTDKFLEKSEQWLSSPLLYIWKTQ